MRSLVVLPLLSLLAASSAFTPNAAFGGPRQQRIIASLSMASEDTKTGTVKWFDRNKGYGFIAIDDGNGEGDIYVHQSNIKMEGFRRLDKGERVRFHTDVDRKRGDKLFAHTVVRIGSEEDTEAKEDEAAAAAEKESVAKEARKAAAKAAEEKAAVEAAAEAAEEAAAATAAAEVEADAAATKAAEEEAAAKEAKERAAAKEALENAAAAAAAAEAKAAEEEAAAKETENAAIEAEAQADTVKAAAEEKKEDDWGTKLKGFFGL